MSLKAAAVDIGTNSCRLLIAQKNETDGLNILERKLKFTRLGEGVDSTKELKSSAVNRVIKALREYKKIIDKYQINKVRVVGTSALRDVENSDLLSDQLKDIGLELEIISGKKEAELNFKGAADNLDDNFLLIDIGGGSTEFIWSNNKGINFESLDIGCVRMTERFISEPKKTISDAEINALKKYVLGLFKSKLEFNKSLKVKGVGGTITTLAAVNLKMDDYDSQKIEGTIITLTELKKIISQLSSLNLTARNKIKGLQPKRADIITAGLVILEAILDYINIEELSVSDRDLLYGLLKEELLT